MPPGPSQVSSVQIANRGIVAVTWTTSEPEVKLAIAPAGQRVNRIFALEQGHPGREIPSIHRDGPSQSIHDELDRLEAMVFDCSGHVDKRLVCRAAPYRRRDPDRARLLNRVSDSDEKKRANNGDGK